MKKFTYTIILIFIIVQTIFIQKNYGQENQGGIPYSYSFNFKNKDSIKKSLSKVIPIIKMPKVDLSLIKKIKDYNKQEKDNYQFAISFDVNIDIKKKSIIDSLECGLLYRSQIKSDSAFSINIIFKDYWLPIGAKLFVYSKDRQDLLGAFTSNNNKESKRLPILPIKGDEIVIEYFEPYYSDSNGTVIIGKVNHGFLNILNSSEFENNYGASEDCEVDINCIEGNNWQIIKRSVCRIIHDGNSLCTGTLLNNTNNDGIPYFLTANHCVNNQDKADDCIFIFNYESSTCGGSDGSTSQSISGAKLKATGYNSDFTLLELSKTPLSTYRPFYAGWDRNDTQTSGGVCIHHPAGDVKKISTYNITPANSNCFAGRPNNYFYKINWIETTNGHGITEGGSSGSALFNNQKRVIGQLYGSESCTNTNCSDPETDISNYGKLFASWNLGNNSNGRLRDWLDPNNNTFVLDGIEGCNEGTRLNFSLNNTIETGTNITYSALNTIEANNTIESGSNVVMEAGNEIFLKTGFNSKYGSTFRARTKAMNCVITCDPINLVEWTNSVCIGSGFIFNIKNATNYNIKIFSQTGALVHSATGIITGNSVNIWTVTGVNSGVYIATVRFSSSCEEISNSYLIYVNSCSKTAILKTNNDTLTTDNNNYLYETDDTLNSKLRFTIFPNPNNGYFTTTISSKYFKPYAIEIYNNIGSLISKIEYINSLELHFSKSNLRSGIYYIKVIMGNISSVKKLIIK